MCNYRIDATREEYGLGRLVNDAEEKYANCKIVVIVTYNKPHLCLFAKDDILSGDEITYFYGLKQQPWYSTKVQRKLYLQPNDTAEHLQARI